MTGKLPDVSKNIYIYQAASPSQMLKHSVELWSLASWRLLHRSHPDHPLMWQPGHKHVMWHDAKCRNVVMVCSLWDARILNTLYLGNWGETSISQAKHYKNKSCILQNIIKFAVWPLSPASDSQKLLPFDARAGQSCSPDLNKCHTIMISVVILVENEKCDAQRDHFHKQWITSQSQVQYGEIWASTRISLGDGRLSAVWE